MGIGSSASSSRPADSAAQRSAAGNGNYPGQQTQQHQYPAQQHMNYPGASTPGPPGSAPPRADPPQVQATYTIRNEMNLNKGSLSFVRKGDKYCLRFNFDTETAGRCTIYYNATEPAPGAADKSIAGQTAGQPFQFTKALAQAFEQEAADGFDMDKLPTAELKHSSGTRVFPLVIQMQKDLGSDVQYASQTTFAEFERDMQGTWTVKPIKQKIQLGEESYELQEIYGIELHEKAGKVSADDDGSEGVECVICMTARRDTTVLPCRHMCLCANCAKILRFQSNKCPVCREQVASLLQIKVKNEGES